MRFICNYYNFIKFRYEQGEDIENLEIIPIYALNKFK